MKKFCANLSLLFTEVPLLQRFAEAKKAGFSAVEIQFPYEVKLDELLKAKQESGLQVVLINVPAGDLMTGGEGLASVPDKQTEFAAALDLCVEYAEALEVEVVNVLPGRCMDEKRLPQYRQTLAKSLALAADKLAKINVRCSFEAINTQDMPGFVIHSSQQMQEILELVSHDNLYMQYDIYHMAMMDEDLPATLKACATKIAHLQFADVPGRGEPGSGELNLQNLFDIVITAGYQGWLGAEYRPTGQTSQSLSWLKTFY